MKRRDLAHEARVAASQHPALADLLARLANLVEEQQREIDALRAIVKEKHAND